MAETTATRVEPSHTSMLFDLVLGIVAVLAGGFAALTGFGIGSLLTPTLSVATGTKLAVAAIAVPHFIGTLQRFWMLRRHVDRRVPFRRVLAVLLLALGLYMMANGGG